MFSTISRFDVRAQQTCGLLKSIEFYGDPIPSSVAGKGGFMLYWALVFFIISVVAGIFGFSGVASTSAGIAQILFYVFLVFFIVTLIAGLSTGGTRRRME